MPQSSGNNTKARAWVEHVTRFLLRSHQVKRAKELEEFTERIRSLFDLGDPLDVNTRNVMEPFSGYDLGDMRIHRGYQAEEASRQLGAQALTFRGHIFGSRQNLDSSRIEGLGLLAHELTHAIQQIKPHELPQGETLNQDNSPVRVASAASHYNAEMLLLAPAKRSPLTANPQLREVQPQNSERLVVQALSDNEPQSPPEINPKEVANKVYHLMRNDLVLERERAIKLGG